MLIPLDEIVVQNRLRKVSTAFLPAIQNSMDDSGQNQPILVFKNAKGKFQLIDGLHRYTSAKNLGWKHIEAKVKEFPDDWDAERISLEAQKIEVDNNLARADLTQAQQSTFVAKRVEVTLGIKLNDEKRLAAKKAEDAKERERKARASGNAKDLAAARTETTNALHKLERAKVNADDFSASSGKNVSTQRKGVGNISIQVAEETGKSARTIERLRKFAKYLGTDLLDALQGTELDTQEQLEALVGLKNRIHERENMVWRADDQEHQIKKQYTPKYKALWDNIVASIKVGKFRDAHKEYSELASEEGREVKDYLTTRSLQTHETQWKVTVEKLQAAKLAIGEVMFLSEAKTTSPQIKAKQKQLDQAFRIVSELVSWAVNGKESQKPAKITGHEGKYTGSSLEETKRKAQAKADQEANSKRSVEAIKKKGQRK